MTIILKPAAFVVGQTYRLKNMPTMLAKVTIIRGDHSDRLCPILAEIYEHGCMVGMATFTLSGNYIPNEAGSHDLIPGAV